MKLLMNSHPIAQEIRQQRQNFERGLLSIILGENKDEGFTLMVSAIARMGQLAPVPDHWLQFGRWLSACQAEELALTNESYGLLRAVGKVLKDMDRRISLGGNQFPDAAMLASLMPTIAADLDALRDRPASEPSWLSALDALAAAVEAWRPEDNDAQGLQRIRQGFDEVQAVADKLDWSDVREVSGSLINLLDRLMDGTLPPSQHHLSVCRAAVALLETLPLPQPGQAEDSHIDDAAYERVIERADVLASGDESYFADMSEDVAQSAAAAVSPETQLATVLEAIPALVEHIKQNTPSSVASADLTADLERLVLVANNVLRRLD